MNLERVADFVEQYGSPVTLRRPAAGGVIHFDVEVMAVVRNFAPNELIGGVQQGDRQIIISNREIALHQWPGPPRENDQVVINGKTATLKAAPETIRIGDVIAKHTLLVRGG